MKHYYLTPILLFLLMIVISCSKNEPLGNDAQSGKLLLQPVAYSATLTEEATPLRSVHGFLFLDGVLVQTFPNLTVSSQEVTLPILPSYGTKNAVLYLLANPKGVNSPLTDYLASPANSNILTLQKTTEAEFPLTFTGREELVPSELPLCTRVKLQGLDFAVPQKIALRHAHARIALQIDEPGVEVDQIEFRNLPKAGRYLRDGENLADYKGELFDYTAKYTTPVTASCPIGYLPEAGNVDIPVTIYGKFNGLSVKIPVKLPAKLERNNSYNIKLVKVGASLTAVITVDEWESGESTEATPDLGSKVLIDLKRSTLPEGVRCSATFDTLFIPSNKASDIVLALNADYQVEPSIGANASDISITPNSGHNLFRLRVAGQLIGAPAYFSYLKIKNSFFQDYYDARIYLSISPNYEAPIADLDLLATVEGVTNNEGLAVVSPYGGTDITIPAVKLGVGGNTLSSISLFRLLSVNTEDYKAIGLTNSGNNLMLQSAPNTTGKAQAVTALVQGPDAQGKTVSAIVSFTIPAVSPQEMSALAGASVEMGGQTWMQFHTMGTFAADMEAAKKIVAGGPITSERIRADFATYGTIKSKYDLLPSCPPGYRMPTVQEFCDLLGVSNMAECDTVVNGKLTIKDPVTTSTGTKISLYAFNTGGVGGSGQSAVSIQKDGKTMWLTNGRMAVTSTVSKRRYFEFWRTGQFAEGNAAGNDFNWAKRCVKDSAYKGLK